jgi:tetratricopeptide (TPR) repeat protein
MLLATVLLSLAAAAPQDAAPAKAPTAPPPQAAPQTPAPAASAAPAAPAGTPHIDKGLAAFKKRHFSAARKEFEEAVAAHPDSAAAHFYLGYACYKLGEPSRRMNPNKEKAREEFAKAFSLDPSFQPVWGRKAPVG